MSHRSISAVIASTVVLATLAVRAADKAGQIDIPYIELDDEAIQYAAAPLDDPVARLQERIDKGELALAYDPKFGYLPSLLKNLGINRDSQMLVFSKTSFQGPKISPRAPRSLFFGDNAAVGYVQNSDVLELTALDPRQGIIFYTLDAGKVKTPTFTRRHNDCLVCHLIPATLNIPGLLTTSVIAAPDGTVRFPGGALMVDGRTPIADRWGGWYVTGTMGDARHVGNAVAPLEHPDVLDMHGTQNVTSLHGRFDLSTFLEPTSDIVALMTLDHQTQMTNLLIRLGWEARVAAGSGDLETSRARIQALIDELVAYMLFAGEAKIYEPISGVSSFAKTFPARGPRDKQGRSLRDFDLQKRLFRYPLSYMIYSEAFDALPEPAKNLVYQRAYDVLTGRDTDPKYSKLSPADRRAVLEIVRETKSDLPDYWKTCCS